MSYSTLALLAFSLAPASTITLSDPIEGYWSGALMKGRSAQIVQVTFERSQDANKLGAQIEIPDWLWWPAPSSEVIRDGEFVELDLVYGRARLRLDADRGEMHGKVVTRPGLPMPEAPMTVHLKRALAPVRPKLYTEELKWNNLADHVSLFATLSLPPGEGPHPVMVQVWSRGPHERWEGDERLGSLFAARGIAFVSYDKRGCGKSGGDLQSARFEDLVGDLDSLLARLAADERLDAERIGLHAESAGGWVATRAAARGATKVALVTTFLAPTISVRQQQLEAVEAWMRELGFSDEACHDAARYTELLSTSTAWTPIAELRAKALAGGWSELLEGDPVSAAGLEQAWTRRHAYDPAPDLERIEAPWLAHFGELDWVVDPDSNSSALLSSGSDRTAIVLPGIAHGMTEWPSALRQPGEGPADAYFLFNKLLVGMWQRELDWVTERLRPQATSR